MRFWPAIEATIVLAAADLIVNDRDLPEHQYGGIEFVMPSNK
jgi:hypothetical protein